MSTKERAFVPPTSIEYDPSSGGSDTIIWTLGSMEHPWKNIYLRNIGEEHDETIDVFARLATTSVIPNDSTRRPGSFLTADADGYLRWETLDSAFRDPNVDEHGIRLGVTPEAIVEVLGNVPVNRAEKDANGNNITDTYVKDSENTAEYILGKIGNHSISSALGDSDYGSDHLTFQQKYATKAALAVLEQVLAKKDNPEKGQLNRQVQEVAFTGDYRDLSHTPTDDFVTWVALDDAFKPRDARLTLHDEHIADLELTRVMYDEYANDETAGIVSIQEGNGLAYKLEEIPDRHTPAGTDKHYKSIIYINLADETQRIPGTMFPTSGNGLIYNETNGELKMQRAEINATTKRSTYGAVRLGVAEDYTDTTVHTSIPSYSAIPADGQWYKWRGTIVVGISGAQETINDIWMTQKLQSRTMSSAFCMIYSLTDSRMVFHSIDSGTTWFAPYATWHA